MHPLKITNSLLSLNEISKGRAQVALGAGEGNLDAMGLKTPEKIVAAIREATEIVRGAALGELSESGYKGEFFEVNYPCAYGLADGATASGLCDSLPTHDDATWR